MTDTPRKTPPIKPDLRPPFAEDPDELRVARRGFERFVAPEGRAGADDADEVAPRQEPRTRVLETDDGTRGEDAEAHDAQLDWSDVDGEQGGREVDGAKDGRPSETRTDRPKGDKR